jgi:glycosyltransferase involved in cell wall biosynthesis
MSTLSPSEAPLVSVVIAAFNAAQHLGEALESVFAQTFRDFELVVVDDGSTDGTPDVLARFRSDPRLVVLSHSTNGGVAVALTTGCRQAQGRYIARLDADDVAHPDRLARQVAYLEERREVALLGSAAIFTDAAGREFARYTYPATHKAIRERLETGSAFVHSAVTMRQDAFESVGGYRLSPSGQDYDLWLRMVERFPAANLTDFLVRFRVHDSQLTASRLREQALCSLVASAAARRRAAGETDPLTGVTFVGDAVAASLGIDDEMVAREHVRQSIWYAKLLADAGYSTEARAVVERAHEVAAQLDDPEQAAIVNRAEKALRRTALDPIRSVIGRAVRRSRRARDDPGT